MRSTCSPPRARSRPTCSAALPPFLGLFIQVTNPGYMDPMFQGWGWFLLGGAAASVAVGMGIILRMVKVDV